MSITIDSVDEATRGLYRYVLDHLGLEGEADFRSFQMLPAEKVARINNLMLGILGQTGAKLNTKTAPGSIISELFRNANPVLAAIYDDPTFRAGCKRYWKEHSISIGGPLIDEPGTPFFPSLIRDETAYPPEPSWPASTFYIGPVPVVDPTPIDINITENYDFQGPEAIRTDTEPLVPSNRTRTRVSVTCVYPNRESINKNLRHTMAHLRVAPITVLQGPTIREALTKKYKQDDTFKLAAEVAQERAENAVAARRLLEEFGLDPDDVGAREQLKELLEDGSPLSDRFAELNETEQTYPDPTNGWRPESMIVPVVFDGLSMHTMHETPEALRVQYNFWLINEFCLSSNGIRFRDADGRPTHDISKCTWLHRYAELTYMNDKNSEIGGVYFRPVRGTRRNQLEIEFEPNNPGSSIFRMVFDSLPHTPRAFKINEDGKQEPVAYNRNRHYCLNVSLRQSNKLALMPLLGQDIPSVQYLGRKNSIAQVTLNVGIEGLKQLQELNTAMQENLRSNLKVDREQYMTIKNSVLNLAGIDKCVLAGININTIENQPGRFVVTLDLIENRVFTKAREQLVFNVDRVSKHIAKDFWDYAVQRLEKWRNSLIPEFDPEIQRILTLFFGKDKDGKDGLMNKEVAAAILGNEPDFLGTFIGLDKEIRAKIDPFLTVKDQTEQIDKRARKWTAGIERFGAIPIVTRDKSRAETSKDYTYASPGMEFLYSLLVENYTDGEEVMDTAWDRLCAALRTRYVDGGVYQLKPERWEDFFNMVWDRNIPELNENLKKTIEGFVESRGTLDPNQHLFSESVNLNVDPSGRFLGERPLVYEEKVDRAYGKLRATLLYFSDQFPSWEGRDRALKSSETNTALVTDFEDPNEERQALAQLSTYPDMALPTYEELFTIPGHSINRNWVNFAPTWGDLGKRPTPRQFHKFSSSSDVYSKIAVSPQDLVEPWFFYHSVNYKQTVIEAQRNFLPGYLIGAAIRDCTIQTDWKYYDESFPDGFDRERIMDWLRKAANQKEPEYDKDIEAQINRVKKAGERQIYLMASDRNLPIAYLVRDTAQPEGYRLELTEGKGRIVYDQDNNEIFDHEDEKELEGTMSAIAEQMDFKQHDIRRCFPTFRFRFIDFNTGIFADNLYDYNAVKSIDITHDKYDAGLAKIELMNLSGNLDIDQFMSDKELRRRGMPFQEEGKSDDDETQGEILKKVKVKEGTAIQILMGYSPRVEDLDVIFTGRISQVQPGDIMTIVAQDYKTELLNEVNFHLKGVSPKEIIQEVFSHMDGEYERDEREDIETKERHNGTPHLGSRTDDISEESAKYVLDYMADVFGDQRVSISEQFDGRPVGMIHGMRFQDLFSDLPYRMHNVSYQHEVENSSKRDFLATYQPGFDVLRELTRQVPGWVCQVLPYDHLGTLYIGPPSAYYRYTSKYNRDVIENLRRLPPKAKAGLDELISFVQSFSKKNSLADVQFRLERNGLPVGKDIDNEDLPWDVRRTKLVKTNIVGPTANFRTHKDSIELLSDSYGDMTDKMQALKDKAPAVWSYVVPMYFGFDNVESRNIPRGANEAFFKVIEWILQEQPRSQLRNNIIIWDQLDVQYFNIPETTNRGLRSVIGAIRFFGVEYARERLGFKLPISASSNMQADIARERAGRSGDQRGLYNIFGYRYGNTMDLKLLGKVRDAMVDEYDRFRVWFNVLYNYVCEDSPTSVDRTFAKFLDPLGSFSPFDGVIEDADRLSFMNDNLSDIAWSSRRPDYKLFRDMHLALSRFDILSNNIVASTREMSNVILLRYPEVEKLAVDEAETEGGNNFYYLDFSETDWVNLADSPFGIPYHDDLKLEERKLQVVMEKNAYGGEEELNTALAASCFMNRMAEALQPMYRGNILLWGRNLKPYDWIHIIDEYNEMKGIVEAERVIHSFNTKTGWTTMVVPHAVTNVNDATSWAQKSATIKLLETLGTLLDVLSVGTLVFSIITLGTGAGTIGAINTLKTGVTGLAKSKLKGSLMKKAIKDAGKKLIEARSKNLIGKEITGAAAEEAIKGLSLTEISKYAGLHLAAHIRAAFPMANWWTVFSGTSDLPPSIAASIARNSIPEMKGIVNITPLYYQGRPLVAGLSTDDTKYITRWEQAWRSIKEIFSNGYEYVTQAFSGDGGAEPKVDLTEYNRLYRKLK